MTAVATAAAVVVAGAAEAATDTVHPRVKANQTSSASITDLDLSRILGDGQAQTIHYLRYKAELEAALNSALQNA